MANGGSGQTRVQLLDRFAVVCRDDEVPVPAGVRRLLTLLALRDRPVPRRVVSDALWPGASEDRAGANLRSVMWRARQVHDGLVRGDRHTLRLHEGVAVDVREARSVARRLLDGATDHVPGSLPVGRLLADVVPGCYDDWVVVEREQFRQIRLYALETLCHRLTATGRSAEAVEIGLVVAQGEPLRESAQRALIEAYLDRGNVGEAERQYRWYRAVLREELGVDPSPGLQVLMAHRQRGGRATPDRTDAA